MAPSELKALNVGDEIQVGTLLGGLTPEEIVLTLSEKTTDNKFFRFGATFFGVRIGNATASIRATKITWTGSWE